VGPNCDGSECADKAEIGVIVTLSSSEQSRFISYFFHHRSTGDQLCAGAWRAEADSLYAQTNLVSDIPGLASLTDPILRNPWGISHNATSPFWISNQATNTTTLYGVTGNNNVAKITPANSPTANIAIPTTPPGGPPKAPKALPARSPIQTPPLSR
jgi:hypothetical protein